jgi:hypothetical protein
MALTSLDETHILAVLENALDGASLTRMSSSVLRILKVKRKKMTSPGFANSSHARRMIYSHDTAIRIYSVSRLTSKNPFVKISSWAKVMGFAEYFSRSNS